MRVGIIALQHESNTFIDAPTTLADFRRDGLLTGEAVREAYQNSHHEIAGFFAGLDEAGINAVPLFLAIAWPSGTITADTVEYLLESMLSELTKAGDLDGLLVAPHGAGVSQEYRDLDGYWLSEVRKQVGPEMPMICTLDPHANISPRMIESCNATICYSTNPHLDQFETGKKAARLMRHALCDDVCLTQALAMPPVSISIDRQCTDEEPCLSLYALSQEIAAHESVLSTSVGLGFPYADVEELGTSFIVVTNNNADLAQQEANRLADHLLQHHQDFACQLPSVEEALDQAMEQPGSVCLLDVGDNVGGGSPGDGTVLGRAMHSRAMDSSFVCLYDPDAVAVASKAGPGSSLELSMGGRLDPLQGPPLVAEVEVVSLHQGTFEEPEPRHGGRTQFVMGPTAVVRTVHGMTVMLTSQRIPPFSLHQLTSCGLDPKTFRRIVAKGVNAPLAAYASVCDRIERVNTPGVTCADMTFFDFSHRRRPLYPFEELTA